MTAPPKGFEIVEPPSNYTKRRGGAKHPTPYMRAGAIGKFDT